MFLRAMRIMDKLHAMRVFVEVAEAKSFIGASLKLNLTAPSITRTIARLEKTIGVKLFNRSTRHVRLTDAGNNYLIDVKRIIEKIEQAEAHVSGSNIVPKGTLTVTAPVLFGEKFIVPIISEYLESYESVVVKASFFDRVSNILEEGIDVAVRIGNLKDSSLHATSCGSIKRIVCASPGYLEKYGTPHHPSELLSHQVILATTVEASTTWQFITKNNKIEVKVSPRLICNQNNSVIKAILKDGGITRLMSYQVGKELEEGRLVRILDEYNTSSLPISIVNIEGRQANAKIRAFVNLTVNRLRLNSYLN